MIIYGASGHGLVIKDILERGGFSNIRFVDDSEKADWIGGLVLTPQEIDGLSKLPCILAIGKNDVRKKLSISLNGIFVSAVHPQAILAIDPKTIGVGTVIMAGVVVNPASQIGRHVILNTSSSIDHECYIGDYVHISPNATLCGNVVVGEGAHIGAGATVIQGIRIGQWATVGAGAVVIRDVPDYAVVVGNPARILRYNSSNIED
jgi:sugar O-acyltransferase (sialic acid O-acetyltransferase NeuD family)